MSADSRLLDNDADSTLRAHEDARAALVAGVLALTQLEDQVSGNIREREAVDSAKAEVHPLRSAHAALIAARKELVMAEQRAVARMRALQRQHPA